MQVELSYLQLCRSGRSPRYAAVGSGERMQVELSYLQLCRSGRSPRCAAVGSGERMQVEGDMLGERGQELAGRALDENPGDGDSLRRLARRLAAGLGA
eukprot:COSAG03_NODE_2473_length_2722_cov_8.167747_3_plen_98_part_00